MQAESIIRIRIDNVSTLRSTYNYECKVGITKH